MPSLPLTLHPSRTRYGLLLLACLVFVAIGVWMVHDGTGGGWFVAGVFVLGVPIFGVSLHPRASYLRLTPEGFTVCSLFRPHTTRWADVREFGVGTIPSGFIPRRYVAWNLKPGAPQQTRGRQVSRTVIGFESMLPDSYGMGAARLAELMQALSLAHGGGEARPDLRAQAMPFVPLFDRAETQVGNAAHHDPR